MEDTIDVRADERFDEGRLADYLKGKLPGSEQDPLVRQFPGGAANLTYQIDYGERQYVLRRPPLGPVAPSSHDMAREYKVLSVLHQVYPLAPRAFLFCDDPSIVGAPFFVMERRTGVVVRTKMPAEFREDPTAARRMSLALVDALADLHAVDYKALGLSDLGKPEGFIERQIEGWYRRWNAAKVTDLEEMDAVYAWLEEHLPPSPAPTLVHNDFKLDNVMFDPADPGRAVAVFDWDMCTLGDPFSDVGALLTYWTEVEDPPLMQSIASTFMPPAKLGFLSRNELVQRYAERSGRDVSDIRFYHVLGMFRVAVIVAQIYIRYHRGQTQDQRFAAFGALVPYMAQGAYEMARA